MAIEDAACLAKCLLGSSDMTSGFRTYEALRRSRTAHMAMQSRRIGAIGQWENPWVARSRDLITRLFLSRSPDMQLKAMYAYEV